ncbi:hypothetical protein V1505DRAFT_191708 [Lipomyces doorenjongii]
MRTTCWRIMQGVTVEAVTEFTKSYTAGLSSSILKYIVSFDEDGYTDDFAAMVDESVDLGDVAESHMKSVTGALGDYVKTADPAEKTAKERVLAKAISSDGSPLPTTGSAVHATLSPFVNLTLLLDLVSSNRGNDGDDPRRRAIVRPIRSASR